MDVRVHRLVADEETAYRYRPDCNRIRFSIDRRTVPPQELEVSAVLRIMRVLIHPAKRAPCQLQRFGVLGCLVCGGGSVEAKALAVEFLAIAVNGRNLAAVVHSPEKTTILL